MTSTFERMPLEDSPWVDLHDPREVDQFRQYLDGLASSVADTLSAPDSRTADSFLTGAQQALARFNVATRAAQVTQRSSFRFAEQKEGKKPTTVFLVVDSSRINASAQVVGLILWCKLQEWKRHPDKKRPVYFLADETTNFRINDLASLMTWGRGSGIRMHLFIQNLSAFRKTYGADALNTLFSETEIKQILPGQREPETLHLLERMLGQIAYVSNNRSASSEAGAGMSGASYAEDAHPAMTADEIRRMEEALLIIRRNRVMKTKLPPIAAINPWRGQTGINPYHGKPFRKRVKLRMKPRLAGRKAGWLSILFGRRVP